MVSPYDANEICAMITSSIIYAKLRHSKIIGEVELEPVTSLTMRRTKNKDGNHYHQILAFHFDEKEVEIEYTLNGHWRSSYFVAYNDDEDLPDTVDTIFSFFKEFIDGVGPYEIKSRTVKSDVN